MLGKRPERAAARKFSERFKGEFPEAEILPGRKRGYLIIEHSMPDERLEDIRAAIERISAECAGEENLKAETFFHPANEVHVGFGLEAMNQVRAMRRLARVMKAGEERTELSPKAKQRMKRALLEEIQRQKAPSEKQPWWRSLLNILKRPWRRR